MDQQEYEQAAECFRCVLRVAELSSDRLFIEAARVAGWLCTVLCHEHPTGEQLRTARIALGKNLLRLSYEDVGLAESALAAHVDREAVAMVRFLNAGRSPDLGSPVTPARPHLHVRFFGNFEVSCNDELLPLPSGSKTMTIFRYMLANRPHSVTQDYSMGWLWPESDLRRARWSLNSAIYALRKLLNCAAPSPVLSSFDYILFEDGGYRLAPEIKVLSDIEEFDARCKEGYRLERAGRNPEALVEYEKATELYRGDFLVEELYEEWTRIERERLADTYADLLRKLAANYMETGQLRQSVQICYRALEKDSCDEYTHCLLIKCYVRLGQRVRALRQYGLCEQALESDCGTVPSPETRALYASILKGGATY